MSGKRRYRCAIYTRKSHEEGLDQAFNSLDAQREACEAYVLSQAGLGWELIEKPYDDGGISGGHMERNGLQTLLSDIRAGQVDVVVVYKVDRLTRSITDFGKLVEAFDNHDVSFVSVTQAFNTTNSMGRLTLNVLLSFAQFEREVTAERIRDKIASSKQKGMWMGGRVPFGYRNENKQLFIEPDEAEAVRQIFDLYLQHENIRWVKEMLDEQRIVSRRRINKSGKATGGKPFSKGNIASILSNPVYAGHIKHKEKIHGGNHRPIIEPETWESVQDILEGRAVKRYAKRNVRSPALFNGMLFEEHGNRLIPRHANKKGRKYYYYVSQRPEDYDKQDGCIRIPIAKLDALIETTIKECFDNQSKLLHCLNLENPSADQITSITLAAQALSELLQESEFDHRRLIYRQIIKQITLHSERIIIELQSAGLSEHFNLELPDQPSPLIEKQIIIRRRGQEMKVVIGGLKNNEQNVDQSLIKLIARAHHLRTELESGEVRSIKEYAEEQRMDHGDAKNLIPLSYLAPSIIEDILAGHQPADLTALRLKQVARHLPYLWSKQRKHLGFTA